MTPSASPHADLADEGTGCHGIRSLCACLAAEVDLGTDGFSGLAFACSDADQVFTLTVQGAGGTVSETIAITRELG